MNPSASSHKQEQPIWIQLPVSGLDRLGALLSKLAARSRAEPGMNLRGVELAASGPRISIHWETSVHIPEGVPQIEGVQVYVNRFTKNKNGEECKRWVASIEIEDGPCNPPESGT